MLGDSYHYREKGNKEKKRHPKGKIGLSILDFLSAMEQYKSLGETSHALNKFLQYFNYCMISNIRGTYHLKFVFSGIFGNVSLLYNKKEPTVNDFLFYYNISDVKV